MSISYSPLTTLSSVSEEPSANAVVAVQRGLTPIPSNLDLLANACPTDGEVLMTVGIASDHGGFALKKQLAQALIGAGYVLKDFGAYTFDAADDYPDFIVPLARAVAAHKVERGIALCGSGIGASIAANKITGVRAGLIHDVFSAHQGVEDDDMNVFCLGGKVIGPALAWDLVQVFLAARFSGAPRHLRRIAEVQAAEMQR